MNKTIVKGYVMVDAKLWDTEGKTPFAKYPISVPVGKNADGSHKTEVYDIVCFGTEAYWAEEHAKKGVIVVVEGTISTANNQDGSIRKNLQVTVVSRDNFGGQSVRLKTSRFFNPKKKNNNSLNGDVPNFTSENESIDPSQYNDNNVEDFYDMTPVDDGDMPF